MKKQKNLKIFELPKLPWVEFVIDDKGLLHQIRCKIYTFV
jgi:hypothetical protein